MPFAICTLNSKMHPKITAACNNEATFLKDNMGSSGEGKSTTPDAL